MKKSIILGIISIVLIAICVVLTIFTFKMNYNMWLAEYNAQISANGFYKSDVCLLNQYAESIKCGLLFLGALLTGMASITLGTLSIVKSVEYHIYVNRWSKKALW